MSNNKSICYRCGCKRYNKRVSVIVECSKSDLHKGFENIGDDMHRGQINLCDDCASAIKPNDSLPWLTGVDEPTAIFKTEIRSLLIHNFLNSKGI
ncbi:hypothetical protein [Gimesia chilikensis]|uniref:Uncharacterized protein n=1 Tax=Gimesia chilikensis TaxID=2605989 RepID=A0A517PYI4_9PLAN|nr:hypothetical protein [Gimesia chilikensis]QDT24440.1 hypothetical protein HG66A1_62720 [Gimesia chilikensis]